MRSRWRGHMPGQRLRQPGRRWFSWHSAGPEGGGRFPANENRVLRRGARPRWLSNGGGDGWLRLRFEVMADEEFEENEAGARGGGKPGVQEPEGGGGPGFVKPANVAYEAVAGKEGEVIEADDGGV